VGAAGRRLFPELAFVDEFGHVGFDAGLGDRIEPLLMEAGILIGIFDLAPALLDVGICLARGAFAADRGPGVSSRLQLRSSSRRRTARGPIGPTSSPPLG